MVDSDLTPRTPRRTGLYVAGAVVLGAGWLASLRLIDVPQETATERRLFRMRPNPGKIVDAYVNLNAAKIEKALIYSVREHGGHVLGHEREVFLRDVKMTVQPAGQKKIAAGANKLVHAWLTGEWMQSGAPSRGWVRIRYNPLQFSTFVVADTEQPIREAAWVRLDQRGAWAIPAAGARKNPRGASGRDKLTAAEHRAEMGLWTTAAESLVDDWWL